MGTEQTHTDVASSRNIVICCDGTSNDVTSDSTNVLRIFRSLIRDDSQIAFYDSGVGTLADPTKLTALGRQISRKIDMAIGHSVRDNVCEAYQFLCRYYRPGDKIYLFGYSRGAYTIRALAGMIHFLGLLRPELEGLAKLGWSIYSDEQGSLPVSQRFEAGNRFKSAFAQKTDVRIHFLGAWDTVSTFGWIWNPRTCPYTANNPSIDHVRHAVAIDERRVCFRQNLFRPKLSDQHKTFREVWFAGSHGDVGGGYPELESGLSKISLQWMYGEAFESGCHFDVREVERFLGQHESKHPKSAPDVLAPVHNSMRGLWHLLEWLPRKQFDASSGRPTMRWFLPNLYRRRSIPRDAEIHASVAEKMERDAGYRPKNLPDESRRGSPSD